MSSLEYEIFKKNSRQHEIAEHKGEKNVKQVIIKISGGLHLR